MIKKRISNPEMSVKPTNKNIKNPITTFNNQNDQTSSSINYNLNFSNMGVLPLWFYILFVVFICLFGFIIKLLGLIWLFSFCDRDHGSITGVWFFMCYLIRKFYC